MFIPFGYSETQYVVFLTTTLMLLKRYRKNAEQARSYFYNCKFSLPNWNSFHTILLLEDFTLNKIVDKKSNK